MRKATFGAGCFWGPELMFQRVPGVVATEVGYSQGATENPTYEDVCAGDSGHAEVVQVRKLHTKLFFGTSAALWLVHAYWPWEYRIYIHEVYFFLIP